MAEAALADDHRQRVGMPRKEVAVEPVDLDMLHPQEARGPRLQHVARADEMRRHAAEVREHPGPAGDPGQRP
ncbi:MAG: hypothetical protein MUF63_07620 [Rhodobacteraceae bacterium]|nr:hypothetical protein [Paracoccaceae bacterium]